MSREKQTQREKFIQLSVAEFFYKNREIAGFSNPTRALYQTIRELVENALDATELYGILPDITVAISVDEKDPKKVTVEVSDNGIGVPPDQIPFVFAKVLYGSKYVLRQTRGVFGLGIKMAALYAQITTGMPIYVRSATPESPVIAEFELKIDIKRNMPIVLAERYIRKRKKWHGTVVRLTLEGNWSQAKRKIEEYIKRTALITPYANIRLIAPDLNLEYKRVVKTMPIPPKVGKPHPYGVDVEMLKTMLARSGELTLQDFLMTSFDGVGESTAVDFLKWASFNPNKKVKNLSENEIVKLASLMKEYTGWRRPRSKTLSPVGESLLKKGVKETLKPEYVAAVTRKPSSYAGNPFIVEAAIAWGGEVPVVDKPVLFRYANKIPLLYDEGADVTRKVVDRIDWGHYKVKFPAPIAVVVHICSTKVPFKGVGKEAIADVPEVEKEVECAIRECARRLKNYLTKVEKMYELARRRVTFLKYIPEVSRALAEVTGIPEEVLREKLLKIMERELKKHATSGELEAVVEVRT